MFRLCSTEEKHFDQVEASRIFSTKFDLKKNAFIEFDRRNISNHKISSATKHFEKKHVSTEFDRSVFSPEKNIDRKHTCLIRLLIFHVAPCVGFFVAVLYVIMKYVDLANCILKTHINWVILQSAPV